MDNLDGFYKICHKADLIANIGKRFMVNDTDIAVFLVNDTVYAISNICPHQHSASIYDGFIEEMYIYCPVHGWQFNIETGRMKNGGKGLDVYPVKIYNNEIYVKVGKKNLNW